MTIWDIGRHAPEFWVIWIITLVLLILLVIFYSMQGSRMRKGGDDDVVRRLGKAFGTVAIFIAAAGLFWAFSLILASRNVHNIHADASTILVSRSNIVASWFNNHTSAGKTIPISASDPTDNSICCPLSYQAKAGPDAFKDYQKLIAAYAPGGGGVQQSYLLANGTVTTPVDTMENQQMLSLAYYRFLYCTKAYMTDILSDKNWSDGTALSFLTEKARNNLQYKKSCLSVQVTPDTIYCADGETSGWPDKQPHCSNVNQCYLALQETIAAQCLLYNDHVYVNQTGTPLGALAAFKVDGWQQGGYELKNTV